MAQIPNQLAFVRQIAVFGLHGAVDVTQSFEPGLNILHGKNGDGKTTLLHVIANLLEGDLEQFRYLKFREITATAGDGFKLQLRHDGASVEIFADEIAMEKVDKDTYASPAIRKLVREHFGGRPVYLPAFRMVLEALNRSQLRPHAHGTLIERDEAQFNRLMQREFEELRDRSSDRTPLGSNTEFRDRAASTASKTLQCREWFGKFTPIVRFPSLWEVERQLSEELTLAHLTLGAFDRTSFSNVFSNIIDVIMGRTSGASGQQTFSQVLSSLRDQLEKLQTSRSALPDAYAKIASAIQETKTLSEKDEQFATRVLGLYDEALSSRISAQQKAFQVVRAFEESVNEFLQDSQKRLQISAVQEADRRVSFRSREAIKIIREDSESSIVLSSLSSGERHVLTLLFSATHMSLVDGIVLIDEPELSLHVDWQRKILSEMCKQAGGRQVIACTHAPEVAADHLDRFIRLNSQNSVTTDRIHTDEEAVDLEL